MEGVKDIATEIATTFAEAFWWMLGAGILHATYHAVPPIGYWTALLASLFFSSAGTRANIFRRVKQLTD